MGAFTLEMFRQEMASGLSGRGHGNPFYDNKLNLAYIEVLTAHGHEVLKACAFMETVAGTSFYAGPPGLEGFISIRDMTTPRRLVYIDLANFKQFDGSENHGTPEFYSRLGNSIYFWPTPDAILEVEMVYWKQAALLALATDRTILSYRYDNAVLLLAKSYAHGDLGEKDQAEFYFSRAIASMRSRHTERDMDAGQLATGVWVPRSWEEIQEGI